MNNFELYTTVLAVIITIKGFISFVYVRKIPKTRFAGKGKTFLPTRLFGVYDEQSWHYFWLAVLWLIVKYYDFITGLIRYDG